MPSTSSRKTTSRRYISKPSEHTAERGYNPSPSPNSNPNPKKNEDRWRWHDLDPNATCIILTDGLKIDSNATPRVENALLLPV